MISPNIWHLSLSWKESEEEKERADRRDGGRSGIEASWRDRPRVSRWESKSTLPWGWICVCRRCRCDSPSCGGPTTSSDDAGDARPGSRDRDYPPRSRCSSDGRPRRRCSSGPPPADFYAHTHTTTFHARLLARTLPRNDPIPRSRTHTHVRQRTTANRSRNHLASRILGERIRILLFANFD